MNWDWKMSESWKRICKEAEAESGIILKKHIESYIINSYSLSEVLTKMFAVKFADQDLSKDVLQDLITSKLCELEVEQDLLAYFNRDFACKTFLEILLLNRGFHAVAAYRISHRLWNNKDYFGAKWFNRRISDLYGVDIHPAAEIGKRLVLDHCFGTVIGETCVIEDDVFLFHNVTLGGTGLSGGKRHPQIRKHAVIGTGAIVLGNIIVGENAVVAAGSVVLNDVPDNEMVAGIPAKSKGFAKKMQDTA